MLKTIDNIRDCPNSYVLAIQDSLNALQGKWKIPIIGTLVFGKKRYKEIERAVSKISPRMLSQELKDLEINGIIKRTVQNTIPVTVEYELTQSGKSLQGVVDAMIAWGLEHRKSSMTAKLSGVEEAKKIA